MTHNFDPLPRPCLGLRKVLTALPVNQIKVAQPLADDAASDLQESARVTILALIEPEYLLIQIPEQMKWLNAHVSSLKPALQKTPEVFNAVRVNIAEQGPATKADAGQRAEASPSKRTETAP